MTANPHPSPRSALLEIAGLPTSLSEIADELTNIACDLREDEYHIVPQALDHFAALLTEYAEREAKLADVLATIPELPPRAGAAGLVAAIPLYREYRHECEEFVDRLRSLTSTTNEDDRDG